MIKNWIKSKIMSRIVGVEIMGTGTSKARSQFPLF